MPVIVWLSALAVVAAVPLLLWAVSTDDAVSTAKVRRSLGVPRVDLRRQRLERPTSERLLLPLLDRLADHGRSLMPSSQTDRVDRRLSLAGLTGRFTAEQVLGAKVLLAGVAAVAGILRLVISPSTTAVAVVALAVVGGFFLPDLLLRHRADKRQATIQRDLPDIIDQLTISVEAGLGFEAALQRVVKTTPGPLSEEFGRMLQDVQVGTRRSVALGNLLERSDAPDLRHVVLALIQADRLGVPLARTLRTQAKEVRLKRRMRAEEAANKIAVKLLFPVVFCLFPALFIVILGPAAIRIADAF
jgi:tight adherence protein C